ncbi:MAG: hypothetical protein ACREQZ_05625 [Woeseiaceae bacterium]
MADKILPFTGNAKASGTEAVDSPEFELPEAIRVALELQRERLFDVMAIVQTAAAGIAHEYDCDRRGNVDFHRALRVAFNQLDYLCWRIEPDWLTGHVEHDPEVREAIEEQRKERALAESGDQ